MQPAALIKQTDPEYRRSKQSQNEKERLKDASDIVKEFVLQINLLNAAGRALGTKELVISGYRESITKWDFDDNFELPARTTAIAFSYDGQMGDGLVGAEEFWHDPFR